MNNDTQADTPAEKPDGRTAATAAGRTAGKTVRVGAGRTLLRLFILLLVLGGLAIAGWFGWLRLRDWKAGYDNTLTAQSLAISRLEAQLGRLAETGVAQDEFAAAREHLAGAQTRLDERLNVIAADMETLRDAAQGGRRDLLEAEVEYLLRIAADELYLSQDVDTAIYALQAADDRLRQLANPRFNPVRQLIADHLRALNTVSTPDVSGMALKLGSLMREVSELPLRQAQHARDVEEAVAAPPADTGWWAQARAGMSRLFSKLVVVQRAEPPPPLLKPEEHFFLYRNVELQLAAARAALLTGDAAVYRQSLEMAREWLSRYFDQGSPAVTSAIADISGLLEIPLQPALPDINPALERFRLIAGNTAGTTGARTE